ncbi:MAG: hypothetical protein ICV64_03330 [Thermoleophilia bacterium]|nr:hypothetical protein [Thermoleophilia bacterium]
MAVASVLTPADFEQRLARYAFERSEEARAVRVGSKRTSEQAAIVARHAVLFTREQVAALRDAEEAAAAGERERLHRLRRACEDGLVAIELAPRQDALENRILATTVRFRAEELPLRAAQARLAVLDEYRGREQLGELQADAWAALDPDRLALVAAAEELEAALSADADPVRRHDRRKGISLRELERVVVAAREAGTGAWTPLRERWFDRILGRDRDDVPTAHHFGYLRRLSPLAGVYTKERAVEVCLATLEALGFRLAEEPRIRVDLDDRPQKNPRACVIASDPPHVVHLITRPKGGLHDYTALLHEAGHALHYVGCDPELPYAFRRLARDHALTEIYAYIVEAVTREPGWHAEHFGADAAANAEASTFVQALLFRRYTAKLEFELAFWSRYPRDGATSDGYAERLGEAVGLRYRPDGYLADMDPGFYSADYLRAWLRSAQLREHLVREVGDDWWRRRETGDLLRELFREGTRPASEDLARRLGYDPLDAGPLARRLTR